MAAILSRWLVRRMLNRVLSARTVLSPKLIIPSSTLQKKPITGTVQWRPHKAEICATSDAKEPDIAVVVVVVVAVVADVFVLQSQVEEDMWDVAWNERLE